MPITLPFAPGSKVLEIGGGDTPLFRPNLDMRKLPTVDIVCNLESQWPVNDRTYDGVFGKYVIEHMSWRKIKHFISECRRVLKPGGLMVMIGPNTLEQCREVARRGRITDNESAMLFGGQEEPGWNEHKAAFSPEMVTGILQENGFSNIQIQALPEAATDMVICAQQPANAIFNLTQQSWYQDALKEMDPKIDSVKLNIGSFTVMYKGWINCDILDLSEWARQEGFVFRQFDARRGIPWPDNSVDVIVASHLLEHITRAEGLNFLRECRRVLKTGGTIRIAVPDLRTMAYAYVCPECEYPRGSLKDFSFNEGVKNAEDEAEALWNLVTAGHVTAYDEVALTNKLSAAGFADVAVRKPGESSDVRIKQETKDMYPELSIYMEGTKSDRVQISRAMKVGLVSTQFFGVPPKGYSGLEMVVWDLACGLAKRGHQVTLFAPEGSQAPPGGQLIVTGPALSSVNADWLASETKAYEALQGHVNGLDIVHGHNWFGCEYLLKMADNSRKVCHTHHGHLNQEFWCRSKPPFKLNFIAISGFMADEYRSAGIASRAAYNGIDLEKYSFWPDKGGRLLFVGRLDKFKQPHVAIEVAKKAGLPIDIVGGTFVQDEAYLDQVRAMCDGKMVNLYENASHQVKAGLLELARALLFPSAMGEPFGLVAAEAMACGTPVIALNDGAISEVVDPSCGFVVATADEMVEAINHLSEINPRACRDRVETYFSRDVMAARYEELYQDILRGEEW